MRKICRKEEIPASEFLQRKVSIYFTKLFLHTGITANQLTFVAIAMGIIASFIIAFAPGWFKLIGAVMMVLWSIFDCVDGEIARYNRTSSVTGLYLDRFNNTVVVPILFVLMCYGVYNKFSDGLVFAFGFSAVISELQIRLVVYNMYASAVDVFFSSDKKEASKDEINPCQMVNVKGLQTSVKALSNKFYVLVDCMLDCPGMIIFVFVICVIDNIAPSFIIFGFTLNVFYMFLIIYGLALPLGWMSLAALIIKNRRSEKLLTRLSLTK